MKHLLSLLLFASPVLAEPVCEKWGYQYAIGGGSVACTKWHETTTPVVTPDPVMTDGPIRFKWNNSLSEVCRFSSDIKGSLIVSNKSDAEALKALGLKMCEGR